MFERGYTPENDVVDEPIEDGPKNSDKSYAGEMKLQRAIELSKNTIAWKLFQELTPPVGLSYLLHMNFSDIRDEDYNMAVSLGGFTTGVSPVEMAAGYSALENDGYYREPTCIVKIMDSQGNEIIGDMIESKPVYQTNAARIMTEALTGVMKNGTAKGLGLTNTVCAGKTGTTNDRKDGWFVGYTPYYTTSVWVGYDLPKSMGDLSGASYPGTIWHDFMEKIHNSSMDAPFTLYDWRALLEQKEEQSEDQPEDGNEAMENTDEEEDSDAELTPEGTGEEEDIEEIQEEESDSEEINEDITEEITDEINDEIKEEEDMETIPDDIPSDEMEETEEMPEEIGDRSESEVTEELDLDNSLEENEDTEEAEITTVP
jgi:membrane peptidoglycan carboxypeptidase